MSVDCVDWDEWADLIKTARIELDGSKTKDKVQVDRCKWCEGVSTLESDNKQGYIVCRDCGAVNAGIIDNSSEWRMKSDSHAFAGNSVRCAPVDGLLPKLSLSTKIVPTYGNPNKNNEYRISRLNQWQSGDPRERAIKVVFNYIDGFQYKRKIGFPRNVLQTTKMLFKEFYMASYEDTKMFGGKRECLGGETRKGLIGLCIYFSCKINRIHCTKAHIADLLGINKRKIRKAKPTFMKLMKYRIVDIERWNEITSKISEVSDFVETYRLQLDLPHYISGYATELYEYLRPLCILGSKQPQSTAAVCLFIVISQIKTDVSLKDVIEKCVISRATIKAMYDKIAPYRNEALIDVFASPVCERLMINNVITTSKIIKIACAINRIRGNPEDIKLSIATAIHFTLIVKKIYAKVSSNAILKVCNVKVEDMIELAKTVVFYKKDLIDKYL